MKSHSEPSVSEAEIPADKAEHRKPPGGLPRLRDRAFRFAGCWLGFAGLYTLSGGTCPCCGQPACPVGLAGAGFVGGIAALGLQFWRNLRR